MNNKIKIGGEFEISPQFVNESDNYSIDKAFLFSSGRSALMAILEDIATKKAKIIYLPYYICSSVVSACLNAGFKTHFYEIDSNYLFPLEKLNNIEKNATLLTVNYFGFVDDNNIVRVIKKNRSDIVTISDRVQDFWKCKDSIADYAFTSLRKHIAVPDGGLVYKNKNILPCSDKIAENTFYKSKIKAAVSKYNKENDAIYLQAFNEGETILDKEKEIYKASKFAHYVLQNLEKNVIIEKRKNNCKKVYELGNEIGLEFIFPYLEDNIPLCVPIRLNKRDLIRKELINKDIFLPIHWSISDFNQKSVLSLKMAKTELSLVIDQRYTEKEMEYQLNNLKDLL